MNTWRKSVLGLVVVAAMACAGNAAPGASEGFEKLKALAGHWQSTGPDKSTLDITLTGGGSTVMEKFSAVMDGKPVEMMTMYYLDGDTLKLTHYCMAGNQPTMAGTYDAANKTLKFDFASITNLKSPDAGHMHHALYTFLDADHFRTQWTFRKDQKDGFTEDVTYARLK
jgi:hypothetical protein